VKKGSIYFFFAQLYFFIPIWFVFFERFLLPSTVFFHALIIFPQIIYPFFKEKSAFFFPSKHIDTTLLRLFFSFLFFSRSIGKKRGSLITMRERKKDRLALSSPKCNVQNHHNNESNHTTPRRCIMIVVFV